MEFIADIFGFFLSKPFSLFSEAASLLDFLEATVLLLLGLFGLLLFGLFVIPLVALSSAFIIMPMIGLVKWLQKTTNIYLPHQRKRHRAQAEASRRMEEEAKKQRDKKQKLYLEIEPISKFGKLLEGVDTSTAFYDESLLPCAKKDLELLLIKHIREQTKELPTEALKMGLMSLPAFQPNIGSEPLHTNIGAMMLADGLTLESLSISNQVFEATTKGYRKRAKQEEKRLAIAQKGSSKDEQRIQTYLEELENTRRN